MEKDLTTEEKIMDAARKIFHQKGYAAARTRDIAEEAGINTALLNYYFRSKEKLFEMVMKESVKKLFVTIYFILNDHNANLPEKIDTIICLYIDILSENSNLPIFILGEIQANPDRFRKNMGIDRSFITGSSTYVQLQEHLKSVGLENINPMHVILNLLSLTVFPFIAKPLLKEIAGMDDPDFLQFIDERKVMIPEYVKSMLRIPVTR